MADPNLEPLQRMFQRLLDGQDRLLKEMQDVKERLTAVERQLIVTRREAALGADAVVTVQSQVDRLGQRLDRIERRLDLVE